MFSSWKVLLYYRNGAIWCYNLVLGIVPSTKLAYAPIKNSQFLRLLVFVIIKK
jgi:hypothetical protein